MGRRNRKNVNIEANKVTVSKGANVSQGNKGGPKPNPNSIRRQKRRVRRANRNAAQDEGIVPSMSSLSTTNGIQTGLARLRDHVPSRDKGWSDQSYKLYCDPCGEHTCSLDAARIPDGALQSSVGGFFRGVDTIMFPWQEPGVTALDGQTFSMLFLQVPLLRNMMIILAKQHGGEFDAAMMDRFAQTFADMIPSDAQYPNWLNLGAQFEYMTMIDTSALRNVVPPNNGVSGTVDSYRFSSQGFTVFFNTPDLVDQGTFTCMRYPLNHDTKSFAIDSELAGAEAEYFQFAANVIDVGVVNLQLGLGQGSLLIPVYNGLVSALPSPNFSAITALRNSSGSFTVAPANVLRYELSGGNLVRLVNTTNGQAITVLTVPFTTNVNDRFNNTIRLYLLSNAPSPDERLFDEEMTVLTVPPITQTDMLQQNPKTIVQLAKETNGVYIPSCIFEPVFNVTKSTSYRKVLFITPTVNTTELIDPFSGWSDTIDTNFGISVANFQGIPYACSPLLKVCRSVEIVPAPGSFAGAFATGSPPEQPEAVDVCKSFTEKQEHGYPSNWNGLGILFGKVMAVVERIPVMLQTGRNIAREVSKVCDAESSTNANDAMLGSLSRGFKRLMKVR